MLLKQDINSTNAFNVDIDNLTVELWNHDNGWVKRATKTYTPMEMIQFLFKSRNWTEVDPETGNPLKGEQNEY